MKDLITIIAKSLNDDSEQVIVREIGGKTTKYWS